MGRKASLLVEASDVCCRQGCGIASRIIKDDSQADAMGVGLKGHPRATALEVARSFRLFQMQSMFSIFEASLQAILR